LIARLDGPMPGSDLARVAALAGTLWLAELLRSDREHPLELRGTPAPLATAATVACFLAIMLFGSFDSAPFIYFQF
jgi:hypothetical protein